MFEGVLTTPWYLLPHLIILLKFLISTCSPFFIHFLSFPNCPGSVEFWFIWSFDSFDSFFLPENYWSYIVFNFSQKLFPFCCSSSSVFTVQLFFGNCRLINDILLSFFIRYKFFLLLLRSCSLMFILLLLLFACNSSSWELRSKTYKLCTKVESWN